MNPWNPKNMPGWDADEVSPWPAQDLLYRDRKPLAPVVLAIALVVVMLGHFVWKGLVL